MIGCIISLVGIYYCEMKLSSLYHSTKCTADPTCSIRLNDVFYSAV